MLPKLILAQNLLQYQMFRRLEQKKDADSSTADAGGNTAKHFSPDPKTPLCTECKRAGKITAAAAIDHIKAWRSGKTDADNHRVPASEAGGGRFRNGRRDRSHNPLGENEIGRDRQFTWRNFCLNPPCCRSTRHQRKSPESSDSALRSVNPSRARA